MFDLDIYQIPSPALEILVALLGLAVGSFLNVLALRTLKEESIWRKWSYCPDCQARLSPLELIPVVSYLLQKGKCKHCRKPIHWQYPVVEAVTAILFVTEVMLFAHWSDSVFVRTMTVLAMLYLTATLIAITITDFREKLIPHEITYPAIILGIIYSAFVRQDLLGTMAGVGASYIIFDFIDHFGTQFFFYLHPEMKEKDDTPESDIDDEIDTTFEVGRPHAGDSDEPFMVMGGGDAVLSALLAAWLGWQKLIPALVIGFLVGAIMGGVYLMLEMKKEKMLHIALRRGLSGFVIFAGAMSLAILALCRTFQTNLFQEPMVYLLLLALGVGGATLGVMSSPGPRLVKHFPFGPALAIGGLCSIFLIVSSEEGFIRSEPNGGIIQSNGYLR